MRQLLGYERFADPQMVAEINALYRELWEPLHNHFCASAKLIAKDRHGAKVKRRHDRPMTPCDRLLEAALRPLLLRALHSSRPTGSLHCEPAPATLPA